MITKEELQSIEIYDKVRFITHERLINVPDSYIDQSNDWCCGNGSDYRLLFCSNEMDFLGYVSDVYRTSDAVDDSYITVLDIASEEREFSDTNIFNELCIEEVIKR